VVLSSITVRNLGTAGDGDIDEILVKDGGDTIGDTTSIAGLSTGVTINLGFDMTETTHYLKIYVVVGTGVTGGETVNLACQVNYVSNGSSHPSAWISDITGETLRNGGFDEIQDASPDAGYLNPTDADIVQRTVFTDNDANGKPVQWVGAATTTIVEVENLGTAVKTTDIAAVRVTLTIAGVDYVWDSDPLTALIQDWGAWNPASPKPFAYQQFWNAAMTANPPEIVDNGSLSVKVEMRMAAAASVIDGRTIRTKTTVKVMEQGQDSTEPAVQYAQSSTAGTTQVLRKQGFETIQDESQSLSSGTAATGDQIVQTIRAADVDRTALDVRVNRIYIRNTGTADGAEIRKIEVKAGAVSLLVLDNTNTPTADDIVTFRTGAWYTLATAVDVLDSHEQVFKIYYTIGSPVNGHTLKPAIRLGVQEPPTGQAYDSDEVTYPDTLSLYLPGLEVVENYTPPEGGVAYSGQRLLAQRIRVEDIDEDTNNVTINPVVVKNIGTATATDITKIEVWRQDTVGGTELKLGESTSMSGLRTGGVSITMTQGNVVADRAGGAEAYLNIYLALAEPEVMVATRTIQLETRVLHTENLQSFDKMASSNQWTLETNHRPVADFTFAVATTPASVQAKADFTYEQTIQFTGTATDADSDAITTWAWAFGDGATASVQNPTHRYPNGGTFTVTLTVTDARGVSGSKAKTITVQGPPNVVPTVAFTWTPQAPGETQTVTFTSTVTDSDQPTGTAFTYAWDFGDTTTSALASPTHAFAEKETYTVKLTVTDAQSAAVTVEHTISVGNTLPVVGTLTASNASPSTGDEVTFTASGVTEADTGDTIADFKWTFGDGSTLTTVGNLTGGTATHVFNAPGPYTVSVIAVDSRGGESLPKTVTVTVSGPTRVIVYGYPNPASTQATFNLLLPDGTTNPMLRIFRIDGRLVLEEDLGTGATSYLWNLLDTAGDPVGNGLYLCVVTADAAGGGSVRSEVFRLLIVR
jgi:PKD repeat protein